MAVDINKEIRNLNKKGLLDKLLIDKTTNENIIWATDYYSDLGKEYSKWSQVTEDLIRSGNIISSRHNKEKQDQEKRTKKHAEVFTPVWVCKKMNDYLDEDVKDLNWKDYVSLKHLEVTCGEAPILVSRYDSATGKCIEIKDRVGNLDRKLKAVTDNAKSDEEWLEWAYKSFQSTYGYEYCGDSLLIARINLLQTFIDYVYFGLNRKPDIKEIRKVINIITWNLWQMDGLTGTIPHYEIQDNQLNLFDLIANNTIDNKEKRPPCRIYDWKENKSTVFKS